MKENGDDTKKWKDIPCSLIGRIIIVKMFILPEAIYRFSVISVKIQMEFFIVICFYSVTKLCLTLCDSMDYSMSDFLSFTISWSLLKLMSVQSMMISNSVILYCPLLLPLIFPFLASRLFTSGSQSRGALSSASVLTMNTQS